VWQHDPLLRLREVSVVESDLGNGNSKIMRFFLCFSVLGEGRGRKGGKESVCFKLKCSISFLEAGDSIAGNYKKDPEVSF
jgi:hypothetical protein